VLRAASRVAVAIGALGSIILMIVDGRSAPKVVLVLFVGWVASPWVILAWAHAAEARWSGAVRATLYVLTLALVPLSLLIYARIIPQPAGTPNAFMFVATAPASWLLIATSLGAAALVSRSPRSSGS
jgi:hypothetical protein